MKSLSKKEFESECKRFQFRGKCAVLFNEKMQKINSVNLEYKDNNLFNIEDVKNNISEYTSGVLVNFEISPKFSFENVEKVMCELLKYLPEYADLSITATYDELKDVDNANVMVVISNSSKLKIFFSKIFNLKG